MEVRMEGIGGAVCCCGASEDFGVVGRLAKEEEEREFMLGGRCFKEVKSA
jgi:hypothetical protein